jgi:hypothetical protein
MTSHGLRGASATRLRLLRFPSQEVLEEKRAASPSVAEENYETALRGLSALLDGYSSSLESIVRKALVTAPDQ